MSASAAPAGEFARALRIQFRVIGALLLREMATRFGRDNLGYLWLFGEPMMLGGGIGAIHVFTGHAMPGGLHIVMFWVTGYVPYYMLRAVLNRAPSAVVANQSLLYHRRITLLDILLARNLLEGASVFGALLVFMAGFGIFIGQWPQEPALVFFALGLMLALSNGIALILAAASIFTDLVERLIHLLTYLSIPFTGAFFMVFWLPYELQRGALTIPTVHCFELMRRGLYGPLVPTHYDIGYVLTWVILTNMAGLLLLRIARRRLVV